MWGHRGLRRAWHGDDAADPGFVRTLAAYASAPVVESNRIDLLLSGDDLFSALLAAVRAARRSITYAQYSWQDGRIGAVMTEALAERCRAGVAVRVLLDGFGTLRMPGTQRAALVRSPLARDTLPWHRSCSLMRSQHLRMRAPRHFAATQ